MSEDRGDTYVRRHYYDVETTDALRMSLYFERNPSDRIKRKAWWLYTVTFPEPVLETPRLFMRRWTFADRDAFRHMTQDPNVMRYVHDSVPLTDGEADSALASTIERYEKLGFGDWAIVDRDLGGIIGESGLGILEGFDEIEIGWMLLPDYWGRGLALEAAAAVRNYAQQGLGLKRLTALTRPDNGRSILLAERLGMQATGRLIHRGYEMVRFEIRFVDVPQG